MKYTAKLRNWIGSREFGWLLVTINGKTTFPADALSYLEAEKQAGSAGRFTVPFFKTGKEVPGDSDCKVTHRAGSLYVTFTATKPKPEKKPYAESDWDTAAYYGDGSDGVYVNTQYVRQPASKKGWHFIAVVDSDTGGVTSTLAFDGPYKSEKLAAEAGKVAALDWCAVNDVDDVDDD